MKISQDDPDVVLLKMNIVLFFHKFLNFWLGSEQPIFECKILHKYWKKRENKPSNFSLERNDVAFNNERWQLFIAQGSKSRGKLCCMRSLPA
jgi:hypothetical protein